MPYIIWMVVLMVVAGLLIAARRNLPAISDYRQSKVLYLASLMRPGVLIPALMVLITFFSSVQQVPAT